MKRFKVRIPYNFVSLAQIPPKQSLKYTIFFNIKKGQKMAKCQNHFISGNLFQNRPNLDDLTFKKAK